MTATELRVGNWIKYKTDAERFSERVDSLANKIINGCNPEEYIPIPLTEEWLIRLGFIKAQSPRTGMAYEIGEFYFDRYDSTQAQIWWRDRYLGIVQRLEYVHQLQNLYFALTGEELSSAVIPQALRAKFP